MREELESLRAEVVRLQASAAAAKQVGAVCVWAEMGWGGNETERGGAVSLGKRDSQGEKRTADLPPAALVGRDRQKRPLPHTGGLSVFRPGMPLPGGRRCGSCRGQLWRVPEKAAEEAQGALGMMMAVPHYEGG